MAQVPPLYQTREKPNANLMQTSVWTIAAEPERRQNQMQSESLQRRTHRLSLMQPDDFVTLQVGPNNDKSHRIQRSLLAGLVGSWRQYLEASRGLAATVHVTEPEFPSDIVDDFVYWLFSGEIIDNGMTRLLEKLPRLYRFAVIYKVSALRQCIIQVIHRDFGIKGHNLSFGGAMFMYGNTTDLQEGEYSLHKLVTDIIVENLIKWPCAGYTLAQYNALQDAAGVNFAQQKASVEALLPVRPPRIQPNKSIRDDYTLYIKDFPYFL